MDNATIETNDIQGLLIRSYPDLKEALYLLLRMNDSTKGKDWIELIRESITAANKIPEDFALHIAFTYRGVQKLIPDQVVHKKFSREFMEGMISPIRSKILGDVDDNAPSKWSWNNNPEHYVDMVLMLFAKDDVLIKQKYLEQKHDLLSHDIHEVTALDTSSQMNGYEHFGFKDGISQPFINGLKGRKSLPKKTDSNVIMPGEFILGYPNEYNKIPHSPAIKVNNKLYDLGKNGSYMVLRQLEQDVKGFWTYMKTEVETNLHLKGKDPIYLASKMVGRWPDGKPLTEFINPNDPLPDNLNSFLFKDKDKEGMRCPLGAHIRRTNPRDSIDDDTETSLAISKRHRILRRARSYGSPLVREIDPGQIASSTDSTPRGLYFVCFNASIKRQFEFIQHAWSNNPKFDGLYNDLDPLIGFPYTEEKYQSKEFTIQSCPVRHKAKTIPQFVKVRGGAYFFLPGLKTLRILSSKSY